MRNWAVVTSDGRELTVRAEVVRWVKDAAVFYTAEEPRCLSGLDFNVLGSKDDFVVAAFTGPRSVMDEGEAE